MNELISTQDNPFVELTEQPTPVEVLEQEAEEQLGEDDVSALSLYKMNVAKVPLLVDPFFQSTGLVCVAGSSDTGKSTFLRQLAIAVASGKREFCGFKLNAKHKSAIYVSTEDDKTAIAYSLQKQVPAMRADEAALDRLRYYFSSEDIIDKLEQRLSTYPADLVVVDTFGDLLNGDLNSNTDVRQCLNAYKELADRHQCLVIVLHHTGKRTEEVAPSKHNLIGSQALEGKVRAVIEMRKDVSHPQYKHLCAVKGNYLLSDVKNASYMVVLDQDTTIFSNTGERVPFDELSVPRESRTQGATEMAQARTIMSLHAQGKTINAIAKLVKMEADKVKQVINQYKDSML